MITFLEIFELVIVAVLCLLLFLADAKFSFFGVPINISLVSPNTTIYANKINAFAEVSIFLLIPVVAMLRHLQLKK